MAGVKEMPLSMLRGCFGPPAVCVFATAGPINGLVCLAFETSAAAASACSWMQLAFPAAMIRVGVVGEGGGGVP